MTLTFSIIKPDAVERNLTGQINAMIESKGFKIVAQKMLHMNKAQAQEFYGVHSSRPFFNDLVDFITSGRVVVQVLSREDAVPEYRKLMGATNPKEASEDTIRKNFAIDIEKNSVHGSDSDENALIEIKLFFSPEEIFA